ncbi:Uncharacterized protein APZ42_027948 [Daphnia magna]|uniref:Reverse transcriptase domain-containing protein n=1 Tax=Daphnia magna TaxID=35525 RepID=A0A164QXK0_9CRUS|nr:Uncharacterized protein APZ42_027948 [Daphnia magna]
MGYGEKSFTVILIQKLIEGLDSKLQSKVKYKEFKDFNDLVVSTRVYALQLEALETDRKELVTNAVANIRLGNRHVEEPMNKSDEIENVLHELTQAVKKLPFDTKDGVSYKTQCNISPTSTPGKPLRINFSFGSVDIEPSLKSQKGAKLTTITNESTPRIPLKILQIPLQASFDTGASKREKKLHTLGRVTLPVRYGESVLRQEFIVTNGVTEDCILGWDPIQKHGFRLDGEANSIYLSRDEQGPLAISRVPDMAITTLKKTTLFRQTSLVIATQMKGSFPYVPPQTEFIFTPEENLPAGIYIEEFIGKVSEDGMYNIMVENHSFTEVNIPRNTKLGVIEIIRQVIGKVALNKSEPKLNETFEAFVISDVDPEFQVPLSKLLNDFHDLFASKDSELGNTNFIKHTIDTQGRGPLRQRPYRVTNYQIKLLEDKVQEMLEADVIRYSHSPWASPVVLVEKKNSEVRFCVDYRKLNSITKKDSFRIPRIDETSDQLFGKKFFTTLDLASGYWQIQVDDSAIDKTAFVVENNLYEFKRMAFGLCNAPATFQRLMNYVLKDVLGKKH